MPRGGVGFSAQTPASSRSGTRTGTRNDTGPRTGTDPAASAPTSLGDLLPLDAAVPLGLLEKGAERGATVRLTAARTGLVRLSSLCLRDALTGAVYAPTCPYEVYVES